MIFFKSTLSPESWNIPSIFDLHKSLKKIIGLYQKLLKSRILFTIQLKLENSIIRIVWKFGSHLCLSKILRFPNYHISNINQHAKVKIINQTGVIIFINVQRTKWQSTTKTSSNTISSCYVWKPICCCCYDFSSQHKSEADSIFFEQFLMVYLLHGEILFIGLFPTQSDKIFEELNNEIRRTMQRLLYGPVCGVFKFRYSYSASSLLMEATVISKTFAIQAWKWKTSLDE